MSISTRTDEMKTLQQLTSLRRSGKVVRTQSAAIKQWPWQNGIVLHDGSMAEYLKEHVLSEQRSDDGHSQLIYVSIFS